MPLSGLITFLIKMIYSLELARRPYSKKGIFNSLGFKKDMETMPDFTNSTPVWTYVIFPWKVLASFGFLSFEYAIQQYLHLI